MNALLNSAPNTLVPNFLFGSLENPIKSHQMGKSSVIKHLVGFMIPNAYNMHLENRCTQFTG